MQPKLAYVECSDPDIYRGLHNRRTKGDGVLSEFRRWRARQLLSRFKAAYAEASNHRWIYSPPIGPSDVIIAAKAGARLPSAAGLEAMVAATMDRQAVLVPQSAGFAELVMTTKAFRMPCGSAAEADADNADTWVTTALGRTPADYMRFVHDQVGTIAPLLEEQLIASTAEASFPQSIVFELANVCNLACPVCPRHHRAIKDGLMGIDDAKRLVSDIAAVNDEFTLYPHYLGETLIHPDFLALVDHAATFPHLNINIISNGVLLTEAMADELLRRPLRNFHFSLHECDTALQEGIHPRHALSSRNVLKFLERAVALGRRDDIWVGVSLVPQSLSEPAVEEFRAFWQGIVNGVNIYSYWQPDRTSSDASIDRAFADVYLPCTSPWLQPVISVDGAVLPCCWDYGHDMVLGNVFEGSFASIYNGKQARALRDAMLSKQLDAYPTCKSCKKWVDYLPAFRQVDLGEYAFSSNGTYLSFATKSPGADGIADRLAEIRIDGSGRQHLPVHREARLQARKSFL